MGASVLADFNGRFLDETAGWEEPVEGRVLLNEHQLVLAVDADDKTAIPLSSVLDVNVGYAPHAYSPFPGTPLTVGYENTAGRSVAIVGGEESTIEKFGTVLFKTVLNGTPVTVQHPAQIGGRVTNMPFKSGQLGVASGGVEFDLGGNMIAIDRTAVIDFDRQERETGDGTQSMLVVKHVQDGTARTTVAATDSSRTLSLLGRYLRTHYDEMMESLQSVSLSEPKVEALVTIYSTKGMDVSLASVIGANPRQTKRLLKSLHGDGLVRRGDSGFDLTTRGQVVVNHYMEKVNT
jgi:helix-turn-helix protein